MNPELQTALSLLLVGMVTVFIILTLVVVCGNLLIRFVNKYFPEEIKAEVVRTAQAVHSMSGKKMTAIISAVDIATKGKGKVTKIERID